MGLILKPLMKALAPATPAISAQAQAPVTEATPGVQAAADAERKRMRNMRGRAATMLTGSQGESAGANVGTTTLLGG
jgi:hypothetical protein